MLRYPVIVAALGLLLAGCGGDSGPFSSTTTDPTTTAAPPSSSTTTTTTVVTSTTGAGPSFVVGTPGLYPPDPLPGSAGASGSGCPPEAGPLPDGIWFGRLLEVSPSNARFDPGCFYFDEAAVAQAALDGITDLPSPHYLRNPLPDLLDLELAEGAVAYSIDNSTGDLAFLALSLDEWPARTGGYTMCPGDGCAVWLYVNAGLVTEILEQYLP